jgi:hypothetical protein
MGLCTFQYKGHTIRDSAQQKSESSSACSQFVSIVIEEGEVSDNQVPKNIRQEVCSVQKLVCGDRLVHDKSLGRVVFNENAYKGRVVVNNYFVIFFIFFIMYKFIYSFEMKIYTFLTVRSKHF